MKKVLFLLSILGVSFVLNAKESISDKWFVCCPSGNKPGDKVTYYDNRKHKNATVNACSCISVKINPADFGYTCGSIAHSGKSDCDASLNAGKW